MTTARLGDWQVGRWLGSGATADVVVARGPGEAEVALKVLNTDDLRVAAMLEQELRLVAALDHVNVLPLIDVGRVATAGRWPVGAPWLAMPLAEGTLEASPPVDLEGFATDLDQVLAGLAHAHARGVLHRDVKAANVLRGPHGRVWLADFGLGSLTSGGQRPVRGGTPGLVAPEQAAGRWWDEGPWSDLYSVGVMAWQLVAGRPAFPGVRGLDPVREALPALTHARWEAPEALLRWLRWLAEPDPARRPRRAAEARRALEAVASPRAVRPTPVPPPRPAVAVSRPPPLLGRDDALARLRQPVDRPWVVVLEGPTGVGKTALAATVVAEHHEAGAADVMSLSHDALGHAPMSGVDGALRRALGLVGAVDRAAGSARGVPNDALDLLWPPRAEVADARFARVMGRLRAPDRPHLLWVDDGHWAPESLAFAAAWAASGPVIVGFDPQRASEEALAARDALLALPGAERVSLGPLPEVAVVALAEALVPLEGAASRRLVERAEGRPLFVVQIARAWVRDHRLVPVGERWALAPGRGDTLPHDLVALWATRLTEATAHLSARARAAAHLALMLGQEVSLDVWRAACGSLGLSDDLAPLWALATEGLAQVERDRVVFAHGMLRDAVVRGLPEARRVQLARAAADALAAWGDAVVERRAALLVEAGQPDVAFAHLADATIRLGRTDLARADACATQMAALADRWFAAEDPRRLEPSRHRSRMAFLRGDAGVLEVEARRLLAFANRHRHLVAMGLAHRCLGWAASVRGDRRAAVEEIRRAVVLLDADAELSLATRTELAQTLLDAGEPEEAWALVKDPPGLEGDDATVLFYRLTGVWALIERHRLPEAFVALDALHGVAMASESAVQRAQYAMMRGLAFVDLGAWGPAAQEFERAIAIRAEAGLGSPYSEGYVAAMQLRLGDVEAASARIDGLPAGLTRDVLALERDVACGVREGLAPRIEAVAEGLAALSSPSRIGAHSAEWVGDVLGAEGSPLAAVAWRAAAGAWDMLRQGKKAARARAKAEG